MNTTRHPTRTGSALIIVIGTLALISVFAAIYIAVGQNDRRSAATVRQNTDLSEITGAYAEHVARVVAENRLDVIMQPVDRSRDFYAPRRVTTDAPYTDWSQRSESDDAWRLFNPAGGNAFPRPRNQQGDDPRVPSNPWLAALRPTYLGDPFERPFSENDPFKHYLDNRDWYQITNVAPDGRFVNLFNLRPTFSDGTVQGSFRAEPGWGIGVNANGVRVRRLSEGLSLYKKLRPNDPNSPIQSFSPTVEGVWLPGASSPVIPLTLNQQDILNTPAVWTMFQRYAFLPADQSFVTYNRDGQVASWLDPDYPPYQWADADGDGMFDSRWFELTSARELLSGSAGARDDVQRLYDNSEFRVFGAVRIVDLSGMVNVNTAIEGLTPPTRDFPLGLTPSEIDLRRLLTMQDQAAEYRGDPQNTFPLSYVYLHQPRFIQGTGNQPALRTESDTTAHRHFFEDPGDPLSALDPDASAILIGRYAAAAARRGMVQHNTLGPQHRGERSQFVDPEADFLLTEGSELVGPGSPTVDFDTVSGGRAATYFRVGRVDPTRLSLAGMAPYAGDAEDGLRDTTFYTIGPNTGVALPFALYGADDLAELLTYHGLNDPENTSRLERNMLGRFEGGNGEERISPLLSTRTLDLDRTRHGQVRVPPQNTNQNRPRQVTGQIADDSMALFELSPRTVMSPLTGAVPLRPMSVAGGVVRGGGAQTNIQPAGLNPLSVREAAVTLDDIVNAGGSNAAFDLFYTALAGELEMYRTKRGTGPAGPQDGPNPNIINQLWETDLTNRRNNPYATLFYAHRGPELAMRVAAHTAVNLKDLYDSGRESTVATLILDNQFGDSTEYNNLLNALRPGVAQNFNLTSAAGQLGVFYPGVFGPNRFDIDGPRPGETNNPRPELERVLPEGQLPARRQAVNVVGVEPMPVISEVASFYVYTDASTNAGGDGDFTPYNPIPGNPIPIVTEEITINGSLPATGSTSPNSNPDLLAAVFAVQLHNPFDQAISLGGGTGPNGVMWRKRDEIGGNTNNFNPQNNFEFDYYLEYNGWFFKLGEFWEFTPGNDIPGGFTDAQRTTINDRGGSPPPQNARLDDTFPEFQYRNVTLAPGETRVFYAMFHPRFDWVDRASEPNALERHWADVIQGYDALPDQFINAADFDADGDGLADGFDSRGWTGIAQEWIERQLAVRLTSTAGSINRAVRVHPFDPTSGALVRQGEFVDYMASPGGDTVPGRDADDKQVRLWRKHTIDNYEEATNQTILNFPNGERRNLVQNDILVDRLYLGLESEGFNYLEVPLAQSNQSVSGTVSLPESINVGSNPCGSTSLIRRNDNIGVSVSRWASVRRRDLGASLSTEEETAVGRVLPWMVQSRRNPERTWIRRTNREGRPGASSRAFSNDLTYDLFFELCNAGDNPGRASTAVRWYPTDDERRYDVAYGPIDLLNAGFTRRNMRIASIGLAPGLKRETDLLGESGDRFQPATLGANQVGDTLFGSNSPLKPEVFLGKTVDSSRIAEALLAMGIGPAWAPLVRDLADPNFDDEEWMTLPEAIALAAGYETITDPNDPAELVAADVVWHDAVRNVTVPSDPLTTTEYVLDNLRLRLDDYVPFINVELNGETGPNQKPLFSTAPNGAVNVLDYRRGSGVPFAFGVLDQLRPFGVLPLPGDNLLTTEQREQLRLTRPVMGLVNVQTAPLRVLRLLPGLTPSPERYSPTVGAPRVPEWWAAQNGLVNDDIGVARLQPGDFRDNPDAAAGIAAYRDRVFASPRIRSREDQLTYPLNETSPLAYQPDVTDPRNAGFYAQNLPIELVNTSFPTDRASIAGIPGLRGAPMFASLGELLAVSVRENPTGPNQLAEDRRHLTVQAYYGNQTNLGVSGTGRNAVTIDPQYTGETPGITPDDYAERLAMAAGLMNTTSVRSDYFAAWLVVQGFRESDVAGLQPEEPLVPSFKRRFLMVIDRSNVINPGDAPRIVLFRELPL